MEGPSIFLAVEQLKPFINKNILSVDGNTKIGKEMLLNLRILNIFSWGKHLVFQFEHFALRVHFLLFGSFEATVKGKQVTGDYPTKNRQPRLKMIFQNGEIVLFSCSLKFLETQDAKSIYDFSVDVLSPQWNRKKTLKSLSAYPDMEIADALLDQNMFADVGNIIKNESLFLAKKIPTKLVKEFRSQELTNLIDIVEKYCWQFYKWRKKFELKKHYQVYRKSLCPLCGGKIQRKKTGFRQRFSFICSHCQK